MSLSYQSGFCKFYTGVGAGIEVVRKSYVIRLTTTLLVITPVILIST